MKLLQKKNNLISLLVLLVFLTANNFFYNFYYTLKVTYSERMNFHYGYCDKSGYGFIKYINEKYNLKKNIKILNYQNNPYKYIRNCDIFILTSKFEGLPNVLLEAAVLKKFIISTNCPTGPREILSNGKGGELVKIGNFKSISEKIISYSKNKNKFIKKINQNINN